MKTYIGVDSASGLVHTVVTTSGNISDVNAAGALLHGDEEVAFGDAGYQGVHKRPEAAIQRGGMRSAAPAPHVRFRAAYLQAQAAAGGRKSQFPRAATGHSRPSRSSPACEHPVSKLELS